MIDFKEEWKFYKEISCSNQYFKKGDILTVSDCGRVKCNGEFHKCSIVNGYYRLCGERLHRIIAEKFLDNWDPNKEVDHKDCNPLNNIVTNLLICDHRQNMNNPLTRKHMSDSKTGCIPWNKDKHGLQTAWNKGISLSEEHKRKVSESLKGNIPWNKGKNQTEETKKKIIEGSHKKSVIQYTLDNKFIAEYISIQEAFRQTNIYSGSITKCCKHKLNSAGGYIWRYKKED